MSYIALIYIVHIEACKLGLEGLPKRPSSKGFSQKLIGFLGGFITISILFIIVYFTLGWVKATFRSITVASVMLISLLFYLILLYIAAQRADLEIDDPESPITELPVASDTAWTGLYFLLPIIIFLWCILPSPERLSAHISAYYAFIAMLFIALTQYPLKALFRKTGRLKQQFDKGYAQAIDGIISGARNMISIGIALSLIHI